MSVFKSLSYTATFKRLGMEAAEMTKIPSYPSHSTNHMPLCANLLINSMIMMCHFHNYYLLTVSETKIWELNLDRLGKREFRIFTWDYCMGIIFWGLSIIRLYLGPIVGIDLILGFLIF